MITRIVIQKKGLFADGTEFPVTGAYERIAGRAYGEVDPRSPQNKVIVNILNAPANPRGRVEYWTDFFILKPVDMGRGNGKVFYDIPNRGNKRILMFLNDAPQSNDPRTLEHAGNGFLMREGYTIAWSGWQGDLLAGGHLLRAGVPIATDGSKPITRMARAEIVAEREGILSRPLSGDDRTIPYPAATTDKTGATLTMRQKSYERRLPVPASEWEFACCARDPKTGVTGIKASENDLYLRSGFKPGTIYELVYRAKNPLVLGLGFAVVRDLISFLRYERADDEGNPNPLDEAGRVSKVYGWGRSQSGRFLRDFVYQGFNEDERRRRVFEAIAPHAAGGGRLFLNYEFARPGNSSQQHTDQLDPEIFPFSYTVAKDPQTGRKDGILKRPKTDPYVMHTNTSTEYWQKRASLAHTDGNGKDIRIPEKVRIYLIGSAQHNTPPGSTPKKSQTQQLTNPMVVGDALRALMVAMDRWVSEGTPPPPSSIPTVGDGTLVKPGRHFTGFPGLSWLRCAGLYNRQLFLDYGPEIGRGRIDIHPPKQVKRGSYVILVPKVDADGNDAAGIRLPAIRAPLGTYTGWNLQDSTLAEGELAGLLGSFIPFAKTIRERERSGDPRLSIEERYADHKEYQLRISIEARRLIEERFLLPEDAERIINETESDRYPYGFFAATEKRGTLPEQEIKAVG